MFTMTNLTRALFIIIITLVPRIYTTLSRFEECTPEYNGFHMVISTQASFNTCAGTTPQRTTVYRHDTYNYEIRYSPSNAKVIISYSDTIQNPDAIMHYESNGAMQPIESQDCITVGGAYDTTWVEDKHVMYNVPYSFFGGPPLCYKKIHKPCNLVLNLNCSINPLVAMNVGYAIKTPICNDSLTDPIIETSMISIKDPKNNGPVLVISGEYMITISNSNTPNSLKLKYTKNGIILPFNEQKLLTINEESTIISLLDESVWVMFNRPITSLYSIDSLPRQVQQIGSCKTSTSTTSTTTTTTTPKPLEALRISIQIETPICNDSLTDPIIETSMISIKDPKNDEPVLVISGEYMITIYRPSTPNSLNLKYTKNGIFLSFNKQKLVTVNKESTITSLWDESIWVTFDRPIATLYSIDDRPIQMPQIGTCKTPTTTTTTTPTPPKHLVAMHISFQIETPICNESLTDPIIERNRISIKNPRNGKPVLAIAGEYMITISNSSTPNSLYLKYTKNGIILPFNEQKLVIINKEGTIISLLDESVWVMFNRPITTLYKTTYINGKVPLTGSCKTLASTTSTATTTTTTHTHDDLKQSIDDITGEIEQLTKRIDEHVHADISKRIDNLDNRLNASERNIKLLKANNNNDYIIMSDAIKNITIDISDLYNKVAEINKKAKVSTKDCVRMAVYNDGALSDNYYNIEKYLLDDDRCDYKLYARYPGWCTRLIEKYSRIINCTSYDKIPRLTSLIQLNGDDGVIINDSKKLAEFATLTKPYNDRLYLFMPDNFNHFQFHEQHTVHTESTALVSVTKTSRLFVYE